MSGGLGHAPDGAALARLDIPLRDPAQLLHGPDTGPFTADTLLPEAEARIYDWACSQPRRGPLDIVVHLPPEMVAAEAGRITQAFATHFTRRAAAEQREVDEAKADARRALVVGLLVLSACFFLVWQLTNNFSERPMTRILRESLGIIGWVALWKPVELLLHDSITPARRLRLLRRIAEARILVVPNAA
jgi:hypothetical protein